MSFIDLESKIEAKHIIGVDEVGRGCFMGPMVVGFCFYDKCLTEINQLNDSKKLTDATRRKIAPILKNKTRFFLVSIKSDFIDLYGLNMAYLYAFKRFFTYFDIKKSDCHFLLDYGIKLPSNLTHQHFKKGDSTCYSIAAASILAKVYRDCTMVNFDSLFPIFNSSSHNRNIVIYFKQQKLQKFIV